MKTLVILLSIIFAVFAQDCVLQVPATPLTAVGLSSLWFLQAPCNQSIPCNQQFVEATILDTVLGKVYVYHPLVVNVGTVGAAAPTIPVLPANNQVVIEFGSNGNTLTLMDNGAGSLQSGVCVNGMTNSIFGQYAYCNGPAFFNAAQQSLAAGLLTLPALNNGPDGLPCPTIRDFFIVDMDQSDNVVTTYLVVGPLVAQNTIANNNAFPNAVLAFNGGDERLNGVAVAGNFGCTQLKGIDLTDASGTATSTSMALEEIFASVKQQPPIALVPISHAMTRVNNQPSLAKTNLYRAGVGQVQAITVNDADSVLYCQNIYFVAPLRMLNNERVLVTGGSPDAAAANSLYAFLAQRYATSFSVDGLNCQSLLNVAPPVIPIKNANGVFVGATITPPNAASSTTTGILTTTNIIIIVVCTVGGTILIAGLIGGIIWYRNRAVYS